jgi:cellulose synthase/poly-beta-1,6-N-acetylglucosamine synthase-like glycosyltransferase
MSPDREGQQRAMARDGGVQETLFAAHEHGIEMQENLGGHHETVTLEHSDELESETEVIPRKKPLSRVNEGIVRRLLRASEWVEEWTPWALLILYQLVSICFYISLPREATKVFWYFYLFLAFGVSTMVTIEASHCLTPSKDARRAIRRLRETGQFPTPDEKLPTLDLVIVAYLPNEQDIIKQQIRYALREIVYPKEKITINVVYNTPKPIEPLETELQELQTRYTNLKVIKVTESTSKAHNLNHFLTYEGKADVIGIYDTDHYPHPHGPRWAIERFCRGDGTDIVQGRCVVYNYDESWVTKLISAEFDMIYAVFHPGRANEQGFGLFGGANGYWRASLLKELKMQGHMLTEDIDSTLRAFAAGAKMVHELNTVSYEQAPATVKAFTKQRLRWAQGWTQVTIRHALLALEQGAPGANIKSRIGIFMLLVFRELFFYILTQFSSLLLGNFLLQPPKDIATVYHSLFGYPLTTWLLAYNILTLVVITGYTIRNRSEFTSVWIICVYGVFMPFYFTILAMMGIFAHFRELVQYSSWNPTARTAKKT